jgi:hypothetical protein
MALLTSMMAVSCLYAPRLFALDNDADDYSAGAVPAGTNLALLYSQHVERDEVISDGRRVADGRLSSDVGILRGVRFVKWGPFIADPQFLLPFGRLEASRDLDGLGSASGLGDLIVTATIWLYNRPDTGHFFGITPALYVPIGSYDKNDALNLGENRWKYLLQAGYVMPLFTPKLSLQLVGDVTFFGKNNDYGPSGLTLAQDPLFQYQAWLKYAVTPTFDIRVGSAHFRGGRTEVDDARNDDRIRTTNAKIGVGWAFATGWNLLGVYGEDISIHNGLKETSRFNLRLMKAF